MLVLILVLRIHNAMGSEFGFFTHKFPTHLRIDGILAGVLGAYFYHYHRQATITLLHRMRQPMLLAGIALMLPPFIWTEGEASWLYTYGLTTNYLGAMLILGSVLGSQPVNNRLTRGLAAIGRHSYSIYLWHTTAYALVLWVIQGQVSHKPVWDGPYALQLALFMVAGIGLGIALSILIEVPTLKLRDRLSPSRSGKLLPTQGRDTTQPRATPPALAPAGSS